MMMMMMMSVTIPTQSNALLVSFLCGRRSRVVYGRHTIILYGAIVFRSRFYLVVTFVS